MTAKINSFKQVESGVAFAWLEWKPKPTLNLDKTGQLYLETYRF